MPSLPSMSAFRPNQPRKSEPTVRPATQDDSLVDCGAYVDGRRRHGCHDPAVALAEIRSQGSGFVWVGLYEPDPTEMADVAAVFGLHELAVEDAVHAHQRPKLERYPDYVFLVLKTVRYVDHETAATASEIVETGEIMIFLGADFLVTVRHGSFSGLAGLRRDLERSRHRLAAGPAAVMHAIADRIVDKYVAVVEAVDEDVDEMENAVFSPDKPIEIEQIYLLKREVGELRRAVAPLIKPMATLAGDDIAVIPPEIKTYFRDVEDHLAHVRDAIANHADALTSLVSARTAALATRQNEDMRKISAWAAIALVPTAIAGVYGMNFDVIPFAALPWGFVGLVALMVLACVILYFTFRRRNWL